MLQHAFIQEQYEHIKKNRLDQIMTAKELVYPVTNLGLPINLFMGLMINSDFSCMETL
jgi:hypothetical protein